MDGKDIKSGAEIIMYLVTVILFAVGLTEQSIAFGIITLIAQKALAE